MDASLWLHQKEGVKRFIDNGGRFGFFFEVGTGKSRTAIECMRHVYNVNQKLVPTLILSPLITLENWKREILKYSKIQEKDIIILHGSPAKKKAIIERLTKNPDAIVIANWEALLSDYIVEHFTKNPVTLVIGDELHNIKTHNAARTKKALQLVKNVPYRIGLTGTPILNSSQDLWSQLFFLDNGKRLGDKFHWFKTKYFYDKNSGMPSHVHFPNWVPRPDSNTLIKNLISDITMSVKKEDCLDLPPLVRKNIYVDLSSDQKKAYEEMRSHFITYINDAACVANLAITKALRLQQILSGHIPLDSGEVKRFDSTPRLGALETLLSDLAPNHKIIVWAAFKENHNDIRKLCEKLKLKYVMLTGDQTKVEKDESMAAFETDPEVRVCIGNQSVGIGINLVASDVSIYYSKGFNLGHDIQSEARNYRAGSERHTSITRYDLVSPNTLDEKISQALSNKKEIGAELLKSFSLDI